ncbi:alpha/beta hydrolase [Falsirhodobacter deserti]|uniref:alpha/beta hydrolase n=1 Tax=Falsirhodobacter deserti TaxID=1365611 RepID=UPI000FE40C84|nr:alpha/beta hydrolase [Falsirhodobacter deserti]
MLIAVNAMGGLPVEASDGAIPAALGALEADAPVSILVHGFRYAPRHPHDDPHAGILGPDGWPRRLGFGRGQRGLCIGFGWDGSGTIWQANRRAEAAGRALATLIRQLDRRGAPVSILAHSLGARVALAALPHLPPRAITRMALLAGAEFRDTAERNLTGTETEVLNITSRENDSYDMLYENVIAPLSGRRTISTLPSGPRVATVQIDAACHRDALAELGFPTRPPERRICHWSCYLRPGMFRLYRRFLLDPQALPLSTLRAALPDEVTPRWSAIWSGAQPLRA